MYLTNVSVALSLQLGSLLAPFAPGVCTMLAFLHCDHPFSQPEVAVFAQRNLQQRHSRQLWQMPWPSGSRSWRNTRNTRMPALSTEATEFFDWKQKCQEADAQGVASWNLLFEAQSALDKVADSKTPYDMSSCHL